MKLTLIALLAGLVLLAGCGDTHESLANDMLGHIEDVIDVADKIESEQDFKDGKAEIEKIAEKLKDVVERGKALDKENKLSDEDDKALREAMKPRMEELRKRMMEAMKKASGKPWERDLGKLLRTLPLR